MLANKVRAAREARCADSERNRDALAPRARACLCVILRGLCCVSPSPQRTLRIGTMMTTTASKTADSLGWSLRVGQSLPDGRAEHLPPATTDCCRRCGVFRVVGRCASSADDFLAAVSYFIRHWERGAAEGHAVCACARAVPPPPSPHCLRRSPRVCAVFHLQSFFPDTCENWATRL